jgi:hypothetical protein
VLLVTLFGSVLLVSPHVDAVAVAYDDAVLADAPVSYWTMSDSSSAGLDDRAGSGPPAVMHGAATPATLPNGDGALAFDGLSQYAEVADDDALSVPTTGVLTLEAWMRPDTLRFPRKEAEGYVHWMGKGALNQYEYVARIYSDDNTVKRGNRISGYAYNLTGSLQGAGSYFQDPVSVGQWIHYALVINTRARSATYPTGYTKVYKNGTLRDTDSLSEYKIVPGNGTAPLRIGTRDLASFFKGAIGKVAVYGYELTAPQLSTHYQRMIYPGADLPSMTVSEINMRYTAGKNGMRNVYTDVTVTDEAPAPRAPVAGATVTVEFRTPSGALSTVTGVTNATGLFSFSRSQREVGTYTSTVTNVTKNATIYHPTNTTTTLVVT